MTCFCNGTVRIENGVACQATARRPFQRWEPSFQPEVKLIDAINP